MGSVAHAHQAHLSHGSHHHSHHPAGLAEYEGRYHVGTISQVPSPAIITEADRKRATLCEAQASLQLAPLSAIRRAHDQSHSHLRGQTYNCTERIVSQGRDSSHAQVAQERAGCPTQPPDVNRLTSVSAFLTPPAAGDARQAASGHKILGCGLSPTLSTPPNTASFSAALPGAHSAVDSTKEQPTMSIAEKDSLAMIVHSPEVPRCISSKGGSISDFTAEMTCLFWFEPPSSYLQSEKLENMSPRSRAPRLSENAIPGVNFRSWVNRIISTTQVTQNVILLALLFIYRLKSLNVVVRGKPGSEFRLLTVALMLGNKFLDDNTYTNKTWSDVSGLHVKEIHVMEVEFLSNMRYGLLVSKEEWEAWLTKLAKFRRYYELALSPTMLAQTNLSPPRPLVSPLSSPTTYHHQSATATSTANLSPMSSLGAYPMPFYSPTMSRPVFAPVIAPIKLPAWPGKLPTPQEDAVSTQRSGIAKRSISFEDITEPLPKRSSRFISSDTTLPQPIASQAGSLASVGSLTPMSSSGYGIPTRKLSTSFAAAAEARRLPAPNLTLNTAAAQSHLSTQIGAQNTNLYASYPPITAMQQQPHPVPQLAFPVTHAQMPMTLPPPLSLGVRAMSTVYPSTSTANAAPAIPPLLSTNSFAGQSSMLPKSSSAMSATSTTPVTGASTMYNNSQSFGTPSKRSSPMNVLTPSASSMYTAATINSSPLAENFPHLASAIHTPLTHSPSVYLQQRSSPYRPIRNVHMLLNPPPTSSLHDYQSVGPILIPPTQMYYNPLGRPNDLRSGIVPEFQNMQLPYRHSASLTPIHTLQQPALQMPIRDARGQQAQQQQQQSFANSQAYTRQQPHYINGS